MWYVWRREEVNAEVWWGNLTERIHLEDLEIDGRLILKYNFKNLLCKRRLDLSISE
jgi:hypothetical protein